MGTINRAANLYRQNNKRVIEKVTENGHYAKENRVHLADGTVGFVDLSQGEYHPRRTRYNRNNQRPAAKRRNIRLHGGR
jgi:hypothetical protein